MGEQDLIEEQGMAIPVAHGFEKTRETLKHLARERLPAGTPFELRYDASNPVIGSVLAWYFSPSFLIGDRQRFEAGDFEPVECSGGYWLAGAYLA